ncbi:MAG TPA: ABC transporter permease [Candidatus Acidoferrales bacterium]|nr:ABC transporter permease [Candidatus Acidoferrales bacterium]
MGEFLRDLRYGLRVLVKAPGFTVVAVLTLALGIGASTSIFSVVDAVLLRPLPYPDSQQIVRVWEQAANGHLMGTTDPNYEDFRSQNHTLVGLSQYASAPESVSGGSEPVRMDVGLVNQDFFKVMGVEPYRGRGFAPYELQEHGAPAVIVSYGYWQRYLGGREDFSQVHLSMDGVSYPVVGVMPQGFDFPPGAQAWVAWERYGMGTSRTAHNAACLGRVRDGFTVAQARTDLDTIAKRIRSQYGEHVDLSDAAVVPLADAMVGDVRTTILTLFGAVILLILVACANVAGLLLARTSARRKELAVRAALGAGRWHLVQQLLAESLVLSVAGGLLGVLLAAWTTTLLPAILPANLPRRQGIAINGTILLFTLAATLTVAIGLGLFAALRAGRVDLSNSLSAGSRSYSAGSKRARSSLVIGEIAATLVMLVGAGLLGRSFLRLISVSPGFDGEHMIVLSFSMPTPSAMSYATSAAATVHQVQFIDGALDRLRATPGVESAGFAGGLPIANEFADGGFLILNGQPAPTNFDEWNRFFYENKKGVGHALYAVASGDYFRTAGIPLLQGRLFNEQDGPDSVNVAVISEALARQQWPKKNPVGQIIDFSNMDGNMKPLTIIGVVGDVRADGLDQPPSQIIYVDYRQRGIGGNSSPTIILRSGAGTGPIVSAARSIFHELDPSIPVQFSTFADEMGGWLSQKRFLLLLAGVFAGAALALAAVGIYGLVAHSVTQRTQEIGVRMALGAQRGDVLRLVVGEAARLAGSGLAIGIVISLAATRLISSLLYNVTATDPLTFLIVAVVLSAVALLASYVPARRAMRVDPIVALRYE